MSQSDQRNSAHRRQRRQSAKPGRFSLRQSLRRAAFHHLHPAGRPSFVRHSRKLPEDRAGHRRGHRYRVDPGPDLLSANGCILASAYITGISVGILVRSPAYWPYALCSVISIMSKYVLRVKGRHIWNPSNFGISVLLFLAPETVASLSIQWGNISACRWWSFGCLGSIIIWRAAAVSHQRHLRRVVHSVCIFAQLDYRQSVAGRRWRRSPDRCISCLFSS